MSTYPAIYAANMTDQQRAVYYAELSVVQKDEVLGVLLAVFLGTFGAHHFYMRRTGLGILYCILSVTGFSTVAGFVEAFFMPERIRRFNAAQAAAIANSLGFHGVNVAASGWSPGGSGYPGQPPSSQPPQPPGYAQPGYGATAAWGAPAVPVPALDAATPALCSSCQAPLAAGVNFCSRCGTAVQGT